MASRGDPPVRVLLVDDDRDDYLLTRDLFAEIPGDQYRLDWVADYDAGLAAMCRAEHDVYLLDYRLGAKTGVDLLAEAQDRGCSGPVILFTGQALQQKRYEAELERKVRERTAELARLNEQLREADRRKDEFLATLAHELRNPLAPIRNALQIIRLAGETPVAVEQARQIMDRQIQQMVRLIDDLLDVSRITRGKLQFARERVAVGAVIEAALELSGPLLERAGLELAVDVPDGPLWVSGDRVRLAQVFSNLLNNAAKYTESGGRVTLTAAADEDWVVVRVRDTGVGIPPDILPDVFDLFTQVDRTLNRSQGGLGIGLALVKKLVDLHGGRVSAAASDGVGKGAEFEVRLPLAGPDPVADGQPGTAGGGLGVASS
jgi:signal transduction histidine kinase